MGVRRAKAVRLGRGDEADAVSHVHAERRVVGMSRIGFRWLRASTRIDELHPVAILRYGMGGLAGEHELSQPVVRYGKQLHVP